jgi:mannose-6-phosphate isomerase-like protein (cupin superfamily)
MWLRGRCDRPPGRPPAHDWGHGMSSWTSCWSTPGAAVWLRLPRGRLSRSERRVGFGIVGPRPMEPPPAVAGGSRPILVAPTLRRLMASRGDLYENRVTGERAVVLRGDVDGGGLSGLVHLTVMPGGAVVGEHVHPAMDERFRVVSGRLQTRIAGIDGELGPGEDALATAGIAHDWWNAGTVPAGVIVELSPADGLANAGRTNAKGLPSPLQLALTASEFSDVIQMTKPPAAIQRAAFTALGAVARRRGLRATYPELLEPHGKVEPDAEMLAAAGLA